MNNLKDIALLVEMYEVLPEDSNHDILRIKAYEMINSVIDEKSKELRELKAPFNYQDEEYLRHMNDLTWLRDIKLSLKRKHDKWLN